MSDGSHLADKRSLINELDEVIALQQSVENYAKHTQQVSRNIQSKALALRQLIMQLDEKDLEVAPEERRSQVDETTARYAIARPTEQDSLRAALRPPRRDVRVRFLPRVSQLRPSHAEHGWAQRRGLVKCSFIGSSQHERSTRTARRSF